MMANVTRKWLDFVNKMNSSGIPLPMVKDPKTKVGSVTTTLVIVSSGLCAISVLLMLGTCIAKIKSDFVLNTETAQEMHDAFMCSLEFLGMSLGAYLGRKMQGDAKGNITIEGDKSGQ